MKLKMGLQYLLYYILGNILFNIVFSITKTILINQIGGHETVIQNLSLSFTETFLFYTILFLVIIVINIIYKKSTIQELNQRLNKVKEGVRENEK